MSKLGNGIRKFAERSQNRMDLVVRHSVLSIGRSLVMRSPVGNPDLWKNPGMAPPGYVGGRFRANWQLTVDKPAVTTLDEIDNSGTNTTTRFLAAISNLTAGGMLYYANNLPYARRLEEGWSSQAPQGMVEITKMEFNDYLRQAVSALPK